MKRTPTPSSSLRRLALLPALFLGLGAFLGACTDEGVGEETGEAIDEAADETGDAFDEAADETEDALDDR